VGAIIWRSARARDADSMVDHVSQPDERPSSPLRWAALPSTWIARSDPPGAAMTTPQVASPTG